MLTRRGKATLVGAVVLLLIGRILGITELFGMAAAALALVAAGAIRVRLPHTRGQITARVSPDAIVAGNPAVLELFLENTGIGPTAPDRLQLVPTAGEHHRVLVPRLAPGERSTVTIGIDTSRRGRKGIAGYDAVVIDALGLARWRVTSSGPISWLVRPRFEELSQAVPIAAGGAGIESIRSAAERLRTGLSLLRGYVEGDDLRRVHWPTTARVGDLMVREGGDPDYSSQSGATILVTARTSDTVAFERAIEVAASIAVAAEREGNLRLVTTEGLDTGIGIGPAHLEEVMLKLATLQPSPAQPLRAGRTAAEGAGDGEGGPFEVLGRRSTSPDDANVLFVVTTAGRTGAGEVTAESVASLPSRVGPVILVVVGAPQARFERIGRQQMGVYLPVDQSLRELWAVAVDIPDHERRQGGPSGNGAKKAEAV